MRYVYFLATGVSLFTEVSTTFIQASEGSFKFLFNLRDDSEIGDPSILPGCTGLDAKTPSTFKEALCSDLHYLQSQYDNTKLIHAERLFDTCFRRLKSGFNGAQSDCTEFAADVGALEEGLGTVQKLIQNVRFPGQLPRKVAFATRMLQVLRDCARFMNCYKDIPLDGHHLVYLIIEAYAEVMTMHDAWGKLDKSIPQYSERLCNLRARIARLEAEMKALPDVSVLIYTMFRDQRGRAKKVIEEFWKQLSPLDHCP